MTYLLYFTAISLSLVSAYYAISGLTAIFAAAVIPIVIMGSVLEFSKLVVASWLYRSWKAIPFLFKTYFTTALVILMLLTSMGIFGFLSKAHLDQAIPTDDVASTVSIIDEKIKTEKENIDTARKTIKQLNDQVDQVLARTSTEQTTTGVNRSIAVRRGQQKERTILLSEITTAQERISKLNENRAPIASQLRKIEAEVGPIKYIAALLYGDNPDQTILEKAVRIVIIMIVIVFDPLAVLLLMATAVPINANPLWRYNGKKIEKYWRRSESSRESKKTKISKGDSENEKSQKDSEPTVGLRETSTTVEFMGENKTNDENLTPVPKVVVDYVKSGEKAISKQILKTVEIEVEN